MKSKLTDYDYKQIEAIIKELADPNINTNDKVQAVFRKHPDKNMDFYKKSEILSYYRKFKNKISVLTKEQEFHFNRNIVVKMTRTLSGITPLTVLTKPFPCPGRCIYCPNDIRMPKSYLFSEPGAQRAYKNKFDPYQQTYNRLLAFKNIGHPTDKIELIILGGTWTAYPENYRIWFIKRCFDAMNDFKYSSAKNYLDIAKHLPYKEDLLEPNFQDKSATYNNIVTKSLLKNNNEKAGWIELFDAQLTNEKAETRCVGLTIETRPDEIDEEEVIKIRKLGATKTQIGFQSLNDRVLKANKRGHDVKCTANAVKLLRKAGFKIHAHWMPNLMGSSPELDIKDFKKMFTDESFKPDELKIYPCSLIENTELMEYYKKGLWKPYTNEELLHVLSECIKMTPRYCRITRMIRDISSDDIVTGNKITNFRETVEKQLRKNKVSINEIRSREIRNLKVDLNELKIKEFKYNTKSSVEYFIEYTDHDDHIAGFLRLSLPLESCFIEELDKSTIIREVHIYGKSLEIGETESGKAQHIGLGKSLIVYAQQISKNKGFKKICVISSVGTREYYKKLGFEKGSLYQFKYL